MYSWVGIGERIEEIGCETAKVGLEVSDFGDRMFVSVVSCMD